MKNQITTTKLSLISLLLIFLAGCRTDDKYLRNYYLGPMNFTEFTTSELIVEVTPDVESFRIEREGTLKAEEYPLIRIDTTKTTAKHNHHFINTVDIEMGEILGRFTLIPETKKSYRDVVIIPKNITEEVKIFYGPRFKTVLPYPPPIIPDSLIEELVVILRPKSEE